MFYEYKIQSKGKNILKQKKKIKYFIVFNHMIKLR